MTAAGNARKIGLTPRGRAVVVKQWLPGDFIINCFGDDIFFGRTLTGRLEFFGSIGIVYRMGIFV
jgi:hypothetical protein